MKIFYFLLFYLLNNLKCEEQILEYYTNYTLISPKGGEIYTYYFHPHYEVGTVYFKIAFSNSRLSCNFEVYDGSTKIDYFTDFYQTSLEHELKRPTSQPFPQTLKLQVTNDNYKLPYYIYLYNINYRIPLDISKYYFYQLSLNNLEINYDINNISKDIYLKFQSIIEFPLIDNIHIKLNEGEAHTFNKSSSSFYIPLKQNNKYELNLKCNLNNFTNKTAMLIYFEENENNYKNLFYQNEIIIPYISILENNKHYFIDSINLVDGYNLYNFNLNEMLSKSNLQNLKIKIYIKKYTTYDIDYIKKHIPESEDGYDESSTKEKISSFTIEACKYHSQNEKSILIYIDINYKCSSNILYKYSIQKTTKNKTFEFKPYLLNLYTKYDFSQTTVYYYDILFISTNHSNTLYPIETDETRIFTSFYNGQLYVSYDEIRYNQKMILIKYNDEKVIKKDENDMGYFEAYKFRSDKCNSFDVININNDFEIRILDLEINKNCNSYFYIKSDITERNYYYLFHEMKNNNSFLNFEEMPINIIDFSKNKKNNEINLINNEKEYIFKIGHLKQEYNLFRAYLIKNEDQNELSISQGQIRMYTFPKNESRINLDISLLSDYLTTENFINIKILSNKTIKNLYIEYNNEQSKKRYELNNSGINLYYINGEAINIDIINEDSRDEDIPIMIKYPLNNKNLKITNDKNQFILNPGEIGLYKFNDNKIKLVLSSEKNNFNIFYYVEYISGKDINNINNLLLSPKLFNQMQISKNKIELEFSTELPLVKLISDEYADLYLIFSFDSKVTINNSKNDNSGSLALIICTVVGFSMFGVFITISIIFYKRLKKRKESLNTPLNQPVNDEINVNSGITEGNYDDNNIIFNKPEEHYYPEKNDIKTNDGNKDNNNFINGSNDISMENNADLPAPLPS